MTTELERYKKLMCERPEEFRQSKKGLIRIVTDMSVLEKWASEHPERQIGVVYESRFHLMVVDLVDGGGGNYYTYERVLEQNSGAAVVLPITPDGRIVLLKQFRHALREEQLQLPRGFGTQKMSASENARKEAGEEIGVDDEAPIELGTVVANSGLSGVRVKVFLFRIHDDYRVVYGKEGIVDARAYTNDEIDELIKNGEITDGFTLSALTLYRTKM